MTQQFSLLRGCALFENRRADNSHNYFIGTIRSVAAVTSPFQRTALTQLAAGIDPISKVSELMRAEVKDFIESLSQAGMLNRNHRELQAPQRYQGGADFRDASFQQFRVRSAPELLQAEWSDGKGDSGVSTLAARSQFPIELSGRSRVITLIYSILLASGVTRVRFADRHHKVLVTDSDIGFGSLTESEVGLSFYEIAESQRRGISLFPFEKGVRHDLDYSKPLAVIHYGDCDPETLLHWSNQKLPHLVIHAPIGDEIVLGPLVIPGESPCIRCLSLYQIDNFGYTQLERIDLTLVNELPAASAYYIAAIAAAQIIHFIDATLSESTPREPRNTGVGEVTYINFQRLTEPQVVAIARHPLCGCDA